MKRADLTVGQDYLVDGSPDWDRANSYGERWRILDTTSRWSHPSGHWGSRDARETVTLDGVEYTTAARRNGDGYGVLALRLQTETGLAMSPRRVEPIQPGTVRMTWDEWVPRQAALKAQAVKNEQARRERASERANRLQFTQDRLQALLGVRAETALHHQGNQWTIWPAALEALLDLAEGKR